MHTFDRLWRSQRGLVGGLVVALILAVGTLAPAIAPYSYSTQSLLARLERPSAAHWLGTDGFGRDILTRVIWGGRVSLEIGLLATGLSVIVGTVLGGIAAYFGGAVDTAIMRIADVFMAIPALFLILVVVALFGARSFGHTAIAVVACAISVGAASGRLAFDSLVQRDAPEAARGRTFARFETRFQLAWVGGGFIPAAIPHLPGRLGFLCLAVGLAFFGLSYLAAVRTSRPSSEIVPR